jgi:hypothetical protein
MVSSWLEEADELVRGVVILFNFIWLIFGGERKQK